MVQYVDWSTGLDSRTAAAAISVKDWPDGIGAKWNGALSTEMFATLTVFQYS